MLVYQIAHRVSVLLLLRVASQLYHCIYRVHSMGGGPKSSRWLGANLLSEFCIGIEMYGISLSNRSNSPMPNSGFGGSKFDLICIKADHYRGCII
jgi:hypothetical protein